MARQFLHRPVDPFKFTIIYAILNFPGFNSAVAADFQQSQRRSELDITAQIVDLIVDFNRKFIAVAVAVDHNCIRKFLFPYLIDLFNIFISSASENVIVLTDPG